MSQAESAALPALRAARVLAPTPQPRAVAAVAAAEQQQLVAQVEMARATPVVPEARQARLQPQARVAMAKLVAHLPTSVAAPARELAAVAVVAEPTA